MKVIKTMRMLSVLKMGLGTTSRRKWFQMSLGQTSQDTSHFTKFLKKFWRKPQVFSHSRDWDNKLVSCNKVGANRRWPRCPSCTICRRKYNNSHQDYRRRRSSGSALNLNKSRKSSKKTRSGNLCSDFSDAILRKGPYLEVLTARLGNRHSGTKVSCLYRPFSCRTSSPSKSIPKWPCYSWLILTL